MVVLISFTSIRKNICNYCWLVAGIEVMLIYTFLSFVIQLLFLSFEMMLLLMCFSVSTWGTKLYKIRSSFYLFVFTVFGGIFWVICTVTLSLITGSNNYILDFSVNLNQQISFALMFTVALGIKVPVFPFHLWLPEVHSETDTCGSVLLAGVLLKVGSYGLMRFTLTLFPVGYSYWSCFIFVVSLFGSYLGSINCLTIYFVVPMRIGISDKQFTSEMNNVHPTTRNTPVRSAYSTLFSTDTSFSSIRLSCHVISLPTCTIGADRPTRNNRNGSHRLGSPAVCKRSCIKLNPGTRPCCQIS